MNGTTKKPKAVVVRDRRRLSLTWIDFLVIAATVLTFAAVFSATLGRG